VLNENHEGELEILFVLILECDLDRLQIASISRRVLPEFYDNSHSTSAFHKTLDRRFAKFVVNFISSIRTWEFQYATVNQMTDFETNLGISRRTSWECGEVISP